MKVRTLLIDANYLLKRSFTGLNKSTPKIEDTYEVPYIFISVVRGLVKSIAPHKILLVWDAEDGGILRRRIDEDYKANREGKPWSPQVEDEDLRESILGTKKVLSHQKAVVCSIAQNLFMRIMEYPEHEADDLIAEYCNKHSEGEDVYIYTNDGDILQLGNGENIRVILGRDTLSTEDGLIYSASDDKGCISIFGCLPCNIPVLKAIAGDKSDNIIGFKGVSEQRVCEAVPDLAHRCMRMEEVLDRIEASHKEKPMQWKFNVYACLTSSDYERLDAYKLEKTEDGFSFDGIDFAYKNSFKGKTWSEMTIPKLFSKAKYDIGKLSRFISYLIAEEYLDVDRPERNHSLADLSKPMITPDASQHVEDMAVGWLDADGLGARNLIPIFESTDFLLNYRMASYNDRDWKSPRFKESFRMYTEPFLTSNIAYEKKLASST